MARLPLIHIPNGIYSVVSKCNNDEFHFDSSQKFNMYLEHILECKEKLGFKMYDICCMSNHVHEMYVVPEDVTIAQILQQVKGHFSLKYNKRFNRKGHFWRNKPFYRIVEDERYALASCAYFHNNPVKAGIVPHPAQWPFSGYRFHVLGIRDGLVGKLLEAIPGVTKEGWQYIDPAHVERVAYLLSKPRTRFIGNRDFRKSLGVSDTSSQ